MPQCGWKKKPKTRKTPQPCPASLASLIWALLGGEALQHPTPGGLVHLPASGLETAGQGPGPCPPCLQPDDRPTGWGSPREGPESQPLPPSLPPREVSAETGDKAFDLLLLSCQLSLGLHRRRSRKCPRAGIQGGGGLSAGGWSTLQRAPVSPY